MSSQTITDKSNVIRNETEQYANTRGRVADVIDDINETKADKTEVAQSLSNQNSALQDHINDESNPHRVTKEQIGLGNVDNTSDMDKPVSSAQSAAIAQETSRAQSAEQSVYATVSQEVSDRKNADGALQTQINNNSAAVAQEVTDRKAAVSAEAAARQNADALLLAKPKTTQTAPDTTYKYVPLLDASGNSTQMLAGDLGKNIANSALTSVAAASFTLGAAYTWNTANFPLSITNLPDKSSDSTYNQILVENSAGQVGKSNGKAIIQNMPNTLSDSEKTAWKTAMNGGWTTNTMSVFLINPIVIQNTDSTQYVALMGANLNLNPTNFKVEIMDNAGATSIASIDNSQVQLNTAGTSLLFYYNFKNIPIGQYKIRLSNGVATYVTPVFFRVIAQSNLNYVDTSNFTYTAAVNPLAGTYTDFTASGNSVDAGSNAANISQLSDHTIIASILSSGIKLKDGTPLTWADNFYLEFMTNRNSYASEYEFGISDGSAAVANDQFAAMEFLYAIGWSDVSNPNGNRIAAWTTLAPTTIIFAKTDNLLLMVVSNSLGSFTKSVTMNSTSPVTIKFNKLAFGQDKTARAQLTFNNGYKF